MRAHNADDILRWPMARGAVGRLFTLVLTRRGVPEGESIVGAQVVECLDGRLDLIVIAAAGKAGDLVDVGP